MSTLCHLSMYVTHVTCVTGKGNNESIEFPTYGGYVLLILVLPTV